MVQSGICRMLALLGTKRSMTVLSECCRNVSRVLRKDEFLEFSMSRPAAAPNSKNYGVVGFFLITNRRVFYRNLSTHAVGFIFIAL